MLKFKDSFILWSWNEDSLKPQAWICWWHFESSNWNFSYFTFVNLSLNSFNIYLLLNDVSDVDDYLKGVDFGVILDYELTFVISWHFGCVFKLKRVVIGMIDNKGLIINGIFESKFGDNTFGCSLHRKSDEMNFFMSDLLVEC